MNIKKTNLNFVLLDLFDDENDLAKAVNKLKPKYLITKSKKFSSYIKINPLSYFSSEEISKREIQAVLESEKIVDKFKNIPFVDNILMESTMYNFNDHNLKTIRSYLFVLDKLITNSSQELLFFIPKTSTSCRVYLYEGEGETQIHGNKLMYRKSDYLPAVITSFLEACNQNYKNYNYGKRLFSNVELFLRQRVRVYGRLILKSFYVIITSQKIKIKNFLKNGFNKKNKINSDKIHIFLTRSTAHAEYLEDIINEIPEKTILLVTSLYKKHKTHFEYCNMINLRSNVEDLYQYNNTKSSLKKLLYYCSIIFLCDLFCIFRKPLNYFKFNNKVFRINLSQFFIESLVKKFESELIIQSINNYFLLNKIKPISFNHCELTSQHQRFFYEFIKSKFPKCLINQISFWSEKNFILERTRYIHSDKLYTFDLGHAKDLKKFCILLFPTLPIRTRMFNYKQSLSTNW